MVLAPAPTKARDCSCGCCLSPHHLCSPISPPAICPHAAIAPCPLHLPSCPHSFCSLPIPTTVYSCSGRALALALLQPRAWSTCFLWFGNSCCSSCSSRKVPEPGPQLLPLLLGAMGLDWGCSKHVSHAVGWSGARACQNQRVSYRNGGQVGGGRGCRAGGRDVGADREADAAWGKGWQVPEKGQVTEGACMGGKVSGEQGTNICGVCSKGAKWGGGKWQRERCVGSNYQGSDCFTMPPTVLPMPWPLLPPPPPTPSAFAFPVVGEGGGVNVRHDN